MMGLAKRYIPIQVALRILPWFIALVVLGLFDFVTLTFDITRVLDPEYIAEVLIMLLLSVYIFSHALYRRSQDIKEEDEDTKKIEDSCHNVLRSNDTSDMIEFVRLENLERRVIAYRDHIKQQKRELLEKAKLEDLEIWESGSASQKKANAFCRKMTQLEYISTEKYISKNKEYLSVEYPKITINFIQSGFQNDRIEENQESPSKPITLAVKDNWFNFITPIAIVAFVLSLVFSISDQPAIVAMATIAIKTGLLVTQHYSGSFYAKRWVSLTWVADTNLRYNLLLRYVKWNLGKQPKKEVPVNE